MNDDLEIDGLGPLDDDDVAALSARGAEMRRTGESYLAQLHYENEIRLRTEKRARLVAAIEKAAPNHSSVPRAKTILANLDEELSDLRLAFLVSWRPDNGPH